jgi:hypothetical protein
VAGLHFAGTALVFSIGRHPIFNATLTRGRLRPDDLDHLLAMAAEQLKRRRWSILFGNN